MTRSTFLLSLLLLAACATYHARPLSTAGAAARYNERRLDDPALRAALDSLGSRPSAMGWRDLDLAQAAWVLRPERARLAAEVQVAQAARITAGAREQPGALTETEYSFSGTHGESRWGLALSGVFTVELGGKRGARLGRANAGVLAAIARAEQEAWEVHWRVHESAVREFNAARLAGAGERERDLADSVARLLQRRYDDGMVPRIDVARAEAERQAAEAELAARRRERSEARSALAAAVGISVNELDRIMVADTPQMGCGAPLSRDSLQRIALDARRVLRTALADYQVAEAEVRLEVSRSWPDFQLGPGLFFDHGVGKWTIAFGLPSLPFNRNRGPIAEAEARRALAAARVAEVQDRVLEDVERAVAGCAAAEMEARSLDFTGARQRLALAEEAFARGESGRLEVSLARLELARAERRYAEMQGILAETGLALGRALGSWGPASADGGEREAK